jgi:hypothetical protein
MGEGTSDVRDVETPEQLEHDVEQIRGNMNGLVRELDRRRHQLFDWRLQLRKNALPIGVGAIGVVCMVGGLTIFTAWRRKRRDKLAAKIGLLRDALSRMIAHPERVARPQQTLGKTAVSATTGALLGAAARAVAARSIMP